MLQQRRDVRAAGRQGWCGRYRVDGAALCAAANGCPGQLRRGRGRAAELLRHSQVYRVLGTLGRAEEADGTAPCSQHEALRELKRVERAHPHAFSWVRDARVVESRAGEQENAPPAGTSGCRGGCGDPSLSRGVRGPQLVACRAGTPSCASVDISSYECVHSWRELSLGEPYQRRLASTARPQLEVTLYPSRFW